MQLGCNTVLFGSADLASALTYIAWAGYAYVELAAIAGMAEHIGRLGLAAIREGKGARAARLYWHSVEFALAREHGELKILGAGLASSFGESHFSLESDTVERLPFSLERAIHTPYRHDAFQPRYLVSESLDRTVAEVLSTTAEKMLR